MKHLYQKARRPDFTMCKAVLLCGLMALAHMSLGLSPQLDAHAGTGDGTTPDLMRIHTAVFDGKLPWLCDETQTGTDV